MPPRRPAVVLLVLAVAVPPVAAAKPSRAERACMLALHAGAARVAAARARTLVRCVDGATHGTLRRGLGAQACVDADGFRLVARATRRLHALAARRCRTTPALGPTSADAVGEAFATLLPVARVFGPRLDDCLHLRRDDRAGAACQAAVARGIGRIARARLAGFTACVRHGLAHGTLTSGPDIVACLEGAAARPADRVAAAVGRALARRCGGTDVAHALPGECATAAPDALGDCLAPRVACDVCLAVGAADGVQHRCTRYVDGIAAPYCGTPTATPWSVARRWDEAILAAIRKDQARPPVQARTLFHASAAMWDAWAAYDPTADGWLTTEKHTATDVDGARAAAISFAVYPLVHQRFATSPNAADALARFDALMNDLGYDPSYTAAAGDGPAAVGNRIAAAVLAFGATDGANEAADYADPTWTPTNPPLVVANPGVVTPPATLAGFDPNTWQQLELTKFVDQNGNVQPGGVQAFVGAGWGAVTPFALVRPPGGGPYGAALGGPPRLHDPATAAACKDGQIEILRKGAQVDPNDDAPDGGGAVIDISPGTLGNVDLATDLAPDTDQGHGYAVNPATGAPYAPDPVKRADYARALAEFWADGPQSETPPGHWNLIANTASDDPAMVRKLGGAGPELPRLEWDVKLYLALNGALHDAAVAAWELKRVYQGSRPITLVRWLALHGPEQASTDDAIPLVPGLVEVVTPESSQPGQRHAALAGHVGEIAVRAWPGQPADPTNDVSGVQWLLGATWVPYQRRTFVTPPFPGWVSGHSTYSRAAAEVLTAFTGSEYFPGGLGEYVVPRGFLQFEHGPTTDVPLQWARYYDAADQAGISRRWGGIHPWYDDYAGRRLGQMVGPQAFAHAMRYFDGTAR